MGVLEKRPGWQEDTEPWGNGWPATQHIQPKCKGRTETSKQRSNMNPIYILNMTTLAAGLRMGWNAVREGVEEGILEVCNKGWRQQGLG